jgi:hypothetical protein
MRRADQVDVEIPCPRGMALDRRAKDVDGRLHVSDCVLTAAVVSPYLGKEIPNAEKLGLDPTRLYDLYRDDRALRDALPQFENLPLMMVHVSTTAASPQKDMVCGSISNARWRAGQVIGDLSVWDQAAIDLIESGQQRALSCGYRYTCKMGRGTAPDGTPYEGVMAGPFSMNHCALVAVGRVEGAMVNDALPYHVAIERLVPGINRLR